VQITKLEFRDHQIIVRCKRRRPRKRHWRDHIQIGMGGRRLSSDADRLDAGSGPAGIAAGMAAPIFLEFGKPLPDLTPDELKQLLSPS